jgi:hypothetical protein
MSTGAGILPELRIALVNFGPSGIEEGSAGRWESAMRWDTTISVLRAWHPHIALCQEISVGVPGGLRTQLWPTVNTLGMVPLLGPPSPDSALGNHPAVLVSVGEGLTVEDASLSWPPGDGTESAWCEALVQVPGWARSLRMYSVDLPWRSSVEQRSQADRLATRIAELAEVGELAIAGGNWNSFSRTDPIMPGTLEAMPLHLRPSRTRYSPRDRSLAPNYDVHDVLAGVGMEDAAAARIPTQSDGVGQPSADIQLNRIYLIRDLVGAVVRYVHQDTRDSGRRAMMLTLDASAAASSGC